MLSCTNNTHTARCAILFICILTSWTYQPAHAEAPTVTDTPIPAPSRTPKPKERKGRGAFNLGLTSWGGIIVSFNGDGQLRDSQNWTLGTEISVIQAPENTLANQPPLPNNIFPSDANGFGDGITYNLRLLYWTQPELFGLYIGPRAFIGYYDTHIARPMTNVLSPLLLGAGAVAGWTWPFAHDSDVGIENNLFATNYGLWYDIRLTIGYYSKNH